jgi:hypothetical protein
MKSDREILDRIRAILPEDGKAWCKHCDRPTFSGLFTVEGDADCPVCGNCIGPLDALTAVEDILWESCELTPEECVERMRQCCGSSDIQIGPIGGMPERPTVPSVDGPGVGA